MWRVVRERVVVKSPVRENRPPGSVRGAPGNRRPYRDPCPGEDVKNDVPQPLAEGLPNKCGMNHKYCVVHPSLGER
jgi:hypothetical protein